MPKSFLVQMKVTSGNFATLGVRPEIRSRKPFRGMEPKLDLRSLTRIGRGKLRLIQPSLVIFFFLKEKQFLMKKLFFTISQVFFVIFCIKPGVQARLP